MSSLLAALLRECGPGQHVPSELTQSTRPKPTQPATKNVCRDCGHMIALEDGVWVLDKARERELAIRMRG